LNYIAKAYWDKLLSESFDDAGVCWPTWPNSYNKYLHNQQYLGFNSALASHDISLAGQNIVEVGPGSGFWTSVLSLANVAEYSGFDIAHNSVQRLTDRYPTFNFTECDFSEYVPNENEVNRFDIALSVLVLLHITDNNKFENCFCNIGHMLKKGGYFITLDAVSVNALRGTQKSMADGEFFNLNYHNKVRYLDYYESVARKNGFALIGNYPAFNITQNAFDFKTNFGFKINSFYFRKILNPILNRSGEKTGYLIGKTLIWLDRIIFSNASFSSKWLVFKKITE